MNIIITKSKGASGTYTYEYITKRMCFSYIFLRVGNKGIAVVDDGELGGIHVDTVTIVTYRKPPLWKQDMNMRMGVYSKPEPVRRTYPVQPLNPEQINRYKFEVYELCR